MKLSSLIPTSDSFAGLQSIEQRLERRRYTSRWSLVLAIVTGVAQVALTVGGTASIRSLNWITKPFAWSIPIFLGLVWVINRYTGFLFKQSQEPFHYTFCILEFEPVAGTPDQRFSLAKEDQLKLLRYDLTERLNRRVRRLSFREFVEPEGGKEAPKDLNLSSHIQIEGKYAIREDKEEDVWVIQVWPRVRIGAQSKPFTLAFPVRLPLEGAKEKERALLQTEDYARLVERVYSSVATEIYKQIEIDLRDKMTLFPSESLRALARYNEAQDFENSSTIDAYDRALAMYRLSLDALKASWLHHSKKWLGQHAFWLLKLDWIGFRTAMQAEAKTQIGYSRCLIYRRLISELAGRERNSIFEVREHLEIARALLVRCYDSTVEKRFRLTFDYKPESDYTKRAKSILMASLSFPDPVPWQPRRKQLYEDLREELGRAFAVSALGHSLLQDSKKAKELLRLAETLARKDSNRALLLFVQAELEPRLDRKLSYLTEANQLERDSEIVLFRLAVVSDELARDRNEISCESVEYLIRNYEAVLTNNPGNVASLVGQAYLYWLVSDPAKAKRKLKAGIESREIVTHTFVGDLKYCLARVEAEETAKTIISKLGPQFSNHSLAEDELTKVAKRANQAMSDYQDAVLADPTVALCYLDKGSRGMNTYYERLNSMMLQRYQGFADRLRAALTLLTNSNEPNYKNLLVAPLTAALGYALNDCGNAYLNYYTRFEAGRQDSTNLLEASRYLRDAAAILGETSITGYNLFCALTWMNDEGQYELAGKLSEGDVPLPAAALVAVVRVRGLMNAHGIGQLLEKVKNLPSKVNGLQHGIRDLKSEIEDWKSEIEKMERQGHGLKLRPGSRTGLGQEDNLITEQQQTSPSSELWGKALDLDRNLNTGERDRLLSQILLLPSEIHRSQCDVHNLESEFKKGKKKLQCQLDELRSEIENKLEQEEDASNRQRQISSRPETKEDKLANPPLQRQPEAPQKPPAKREEPVALHQKRRDLVDALNQRRKNLEALDQRRKDLVDALNQRRKNLRWKALEALYQKQTELQKKLDKHQKTVQALENPEDLREALNEKSEERERLNEDVRTKLVGRTRLAPFRHDLVTSGICRLLDSKKIDWSRFGDPEVSALQALAQRRTDDEEDNLASRQLLKRVKRYNPEDYEINRLLCKVTTDLSERENIFTTLKSAIEWAQNNDTKSRHFAYLMLGICFENASIFCQKWPVEFASKSEYEKAVEVYNRGRSSCDDFPEFHYYLGCAHENYARQFSKNSFNELALEEFQTACALDPTNKEYYESYHKIRTDRSAQWGATYGIGQKLSKFDPPRSIEVEIATQSIGDLGFSEALLPPALKDEITDVRKRLQYEMGFTLPGINFRDDSSFEKGQYRLRIRGVPLPMEKLDPKLFSAEQYAALAQQIENVARKTAAQFYGLQEIASSLGKATKEKAAAVEIRENQELLSELTWVLKSLLNQRISVTDFDQIVSEFLLCRRNKLNLPCTLKILTNPMVRNKQNGNVLDA